MDLLLSRVFTNKTIVLNAYHQSRLIKSYRFSSKSTGTALGFEILSAAITGWAVTDLCCSASVHIDYDLDSRSRQYVESLYQHVTNSIATIINKPSFADLVFLQPEQKEEFPEIETDDTIVFLGNSGGKDSYLTYKILQKLNVFKKIVPFKINYDFDSLAGANFNIYEQVYREDIATKVCLSQLCTAQDIFYLEPTDIGVTFLAPFFGIKDGYPSSLALGLQWDTGYSFKNNISFSPVETLPSKTLHISYVRSLGLENFSLEFPISCLHSNAVYKTLNHLIGKKMDSLVSCWERSDKNCGYCPKCQRVKYITKSVLEREVVKEVPDIDFDPVVLYGSISAGKALVSYPNIHWESTVIYDNAQSLSTYDDAYINLLGYLLEASQVETAEVNIDHSFKINSNLTFSSIAKTLSIDYRQLLDDPVNDYEVPYLPFEQYFRKNRKHKVLNCYGDWPIFDNNVMTSNKIGFGPKLTIPDMPVFRNFFTSKNYLR